MFRFPVMVLVLSLLVAPVAQACGPCWQWSDPVPTTWAGKLAAMVEHGYLSEMPQDPGGGSNSFENFVFTEKDYLISIGCKIHGAAEEAPPKEEGWLGYLWSFAAGERDQIECHDLQRRLRIALEMCAMG